MNAPRQVNLDIAVSNAGQQPLYYCARTSPDNRFVPCCDPSGSCGQTTRSVDMEDLASSLCSFGNNLQQQQQQQQVAGTLQPCNQLSDVAQLCCNSLSGQQQPAAFHVPQQRHCAPPPASMPKGEELYYAPMTLEEAAFTYCTDSRWMACPAASYCPLYDVVQAPLESYQALPCAQDFYGYYAGQVDEDAYEEYLSNEKRKEKSRDAARCRRSRETDIFTELAGALPVPSCEAAHLDKASVMRLAIAYLKSRTLMDAVPKPLAKPEIIPEIDDLFLQALDGFVLALDNNGDMVYLSPNVKDYLGVAQMDLMGQSVFDYSHPCDHDEIRESISIKPSEISNEHPCNFFLRLKCTLTSKGRKVNLKSASYKVLHCTGRVIVNANTYNSNFNNEGESETPNEIIEKEPSVSLVMVASPVPHPSNIEVPLGKYTFLSKHNLNMKFTYADDKLAEFLGWESNELMGQSVFEFHHALDNSSLDKSFKSLFHKGQCETMAYRFLNKRGGYAWVVTQATLIHCSRLQKPLSVVCVNYLLSGIECENEVYSVRQLEARANPALKPEPIKQQQVVLDEQVTSRRPLADNKPVAVTASLFRYQEPKPRFNGKENEEVRDSQKAKASVEVCEPKEKEQKEQQEQQQQQQQQQPEQLAPASYVPVVTIAEPPPYQAPPVNSRPAPQTATASIFAPRTKDMNKGFLTFSEDQPGLTMLKDEPEDLTHLAPTAGDVCVPLEDPPFLSDMLDEFILNGNYCPLLSPELPQNPTDLAESVCADPLKDVEQTDCNSNSATSTSSSSCDTAGGCGDPFIYRDSSSRCSLGTDLHSPTMTKSPEGSGVGDSLSSPNGSGGGLSEDEMLMLSITDVMADEELALRAPYIPMSDQDEALQMLISDDMVMWGPSQSNDKKSKWLTDTGGANANSSLVQVLTDEVSSKKMKGHGGTLVNPTQVLGQVTLKSSAKEVVAERTNKRVHAVSGRSSQDSKRAKHNDQDISSTASNQSNNLSSLENLLSTSVQNSQLLQQLVSQQMPKGRGNWSDQLVAADRQSRSSRYDDSSLCRLKGSGAGVELLRRSDDGGGKRHQQSNSVLMNLLVSGCDMRSMQSQLPSPMTSLSPDGMLNQQADKLSEYQIKLIEEQLQTVPQWIQTTDSSVGKPMEAANTYDSANLNLEDELSFINDNLLMRALDSGLV